APMCSRCPYTTLFRSVSEVTRIGMREQQFLRRHRARGVHRQRMARLMPMTQGFGRIRIDRRGEVCARVARFPDHALQRLERDVRAEEHTSELQSRENL